MSNYTLEITESQAQTISLACEVLSRLGMGQWRYATDHLPLKEKMDWIEWHDDLDDMGRILSKHMKDGIDGWRSCLGVANDSVRPECRDAYDIHQVVRKRLAWDRAVEEGIVESVDAPRKWPEMIQTFYDDPLKVGDEPLAKINKT